MLSVDQQERRYACTYIVRFFVTSGLSHLTSPTKRGLAQAQGRGSLVRTFFLSLHGHLSDRRDLFHLLASRTTGLLSFQLEHRESGIAQALACLSQSPSISCIISLSTEAPSRTRKTFKLWIYSSFTMWLLSPVTGATYHESLNSSLFVYDRRPE